MPVSPRLKSITKKPTAPSPTRFMYRGHLTMTASILVTGHGGIPTGRFSVKGNTITKVTVSECGARSSTMAASMRRL